MPACQNVDTSRPGKRSIDDISANEDVARYLKNFKGLGALTDSSSPTPAIESMSNFKVTGDLVMDLVLAEPQVVQPVEMSFDSRGRLWVVQYSQYPFPQGLKVVSVDNYLRFQYDAVPLAPPEGVKGADKITVFEDTDGDGEYDSSTDAITGLNIATSVITGRGKIWVLNPPYLLAYPDPDGDGIPNGNPEVALTGFGMEDLHAVANSLRWGPDGWLYGGQGSTTTANINSSVTKNVSFLGQVIWRYNVDTHAFEVFAEGGGNTFNVEFDSKGRLYSGNNGYDRGPNFKQGAYYPRSLGKHGAYTNQYSFGNLPNMELTGEKKRFTHSLIRYEGGKLPARFEGKMMAVNPLLHYVQLTRFEPDGSTYKNIDEERIVETDDRWFRPVNIKAGPDGAVYIADWYDSRLSNTDPRDTWNKTTGRIYRLRGKDAPKGLPPFDLSKYSGAQLIALLKNENKWFRQHARRQLADRRDKTLVPSLKTMLQSAKDQDALEALWAINACGAFDDETGKLAVHHQDPFVREWGVRLLGDPKAVSREIAVELTKLAATEKNANVRSQLACTAKRLPASDALPVIRNLLKYHQDISDPDIPMLIWWALESKAESDRGSVISLFRDKSIWNNKIVTDIVIKRLVQRYVIAGGDENFASTTDLIQLAPNGDLKKVLVSALHEGLGGQDLSSLPARLLETIRPYQNDLFGGPLSLGIRRGDAKSIKQALAVIGDDDAPMDYRLTYARLLGEVNQPEAVFTLLNVVESGKTTPALRDVALRALGRYDSIRIGTQVVKAYPGFRGDVGNRTTAINLLVSRVNWTNELLKAIDEKKTISRDDVADQAIHRIRLLNDPGIRQLADRLWPNSKPLSPAELKESMDRYARILKSGAGNAEKGRLVYLAQCGMCHRLFDEGGNIGPELTGYERSNMNYLLQNIIDPNAYIREGYGVYQITTRDGRTLEGKILSRKGEIITLAPPLGGPAITLLNSEIEDIREQQTSVMPERILDKLTGQEVQDLFSYLTK